jgi:hypothetical protein
MIRGIPFRLMIPILLILWVVGTVCVNKYAPQLRGKHLKVALWGLASATLALGVILVMISVITAFN